MIDSDSAPSAPVPQFLTAVEFPATGACVGYALVMENFPDAGKRLCSTCTVITECRAWMTTLTLATDPGGVIAGTTQAERRGTDPHHRVCKGCWRLKPRDAFSPSGTSTRTRCRICEGQDRIGKAAA